MRALHFSGGAIGPVPLSRPGEFVVFPDLASGDLMLSVNTGPFLPLATGSGVTPLGQVWYVDGSAPAGGDGSIGAPLNTITAALALSSSGDTVLVAPGAYVESVVLTTLNNICIRSIGGSGCTSITAPAGLDTVNFTPPAATVIDSFRLEGFRLVNAQAGQSCIEMDGTATAVATICKMFELSCVIADCPMTKTLAGDALRLVNTGPVIVQKGGTVLAEIENAADIDGPVTLSNVSRVDFFGIGMGRAGVLALVYTYDNTLAATPTHGRQGVFLLAASACRGNCVINATPLFVVDATSAIFGTLTTAGLTTFLAPNHAPVIAISGTIGLPIAPTTITLPLPALALLTTPFIDFSRATIYGTATFSTPLIGFVRNYVRMHQCRLEPSTGGAGSITAGADTDVDVRGSVIPQASLLAPGNGAIDRDVVLSAPFVVGAVATPVAIAPPLPPVNAIFYPAGAPYNVWYDTVLPLAVGTTLKTNAGYSAIATAPVGAVAVAERSRTP
jgi:hypothetical protein